MNNYRLLLMLFLWLALLSIANAFGEDKATNDSLGGRWLLSFEMPGGHYQTPVEFVVEPDGKIDFAVLGSLGSFSITSGSGRLSGRKLSLNATTSFGKLKVNAVLDGDKLRGEWSPAGFFASLFFKGEVSGERGRAVSTPASRTKVFDVVWEQVNAKFYDPRFNGVDWQSARVRYRPQIESARTDGEFVAIVRRMLAELRSSHLEFFAAPDNRPVWMPKQNVQTKAVSWRPLSSTIGYLKISSFDDEALPLADIDRAFKELNDLPSLVIDLRGNGGGSLGLAMRVGDYIFAEQRPVGYFVNRAGLMKREATSIDQINSALLPVYSGYDSDGFNKVLEQSGGVMLATGGRADKRYSGRVVVLIDENCYSAAEAFASVVKETRAATLIGRRTAGAMLGAGYFPLADDWKLVLPVVNFRTAGGLRVEGVGVEPDISVKPTRRGDAELARALEFFKGIKDKR
ncbi:MAG: S41 family peptidase [Acidobacteriota bacterium]|nr:S41 family peptidase [Acidobacteriota bacterium]